MVESIWGDTKEPGVALFRRLRDCWSNLEIDYDSLEKFAYAVGPSWIGEEGKAILAWADTELR